jgi:hypothetical protein
MLLIMPDHDQAGVQEFKLLIQADDVLYRHSRTTQRITPGRSAPDESCAPDRSRARNTDREAARVN